MSVLQAYYGEFSMGAWADPAVGLCPCHGNGWALSDVDTWHKCPVHYVGQEHPEWYEDSDPVEGPGERPFWARVVASCERPYGRRGHSVRVSRTASGEWLVEPQKALRARGFEVQVVGTEEARRCLRTVRDGAGRAVLVHPA